MFIWRPSAACGKFSLSPYGGGKGATMLWTIALILIVLWVLGLVSSYTLGGFLHILLVLAIVVILIRVIQGRRIA
jgi:hypothetical protein